MNRTEQNVIPTSDNLTLLQNLLVKRYCIAFVNFFSSVLGQICPKTSQAHLLKLLPGVARKKNYVIARQGSYDQKAA